MKSPQEGLPCTSDPELFFPISKSSPNRRNIDAAKAMCGECAVKAQCLGLSLYYQQTTGNTYGIWGGVDEWERKHAFTRASLGHNQELGRLISMAIMPGEVQAPVISIEQAASNLSNMLNPDRLELPQCTDAA